MTARALLSEDMLFGRLVIGIGRSPKAVIAAIVCIVLLFAAIVGPHITPQDPYDLAVLDILDAKLRPGSESMDGLVYWLGTDGQGRDMFSAMVYGLRTSLGVGVFSGLVALVVGTVLGLIAAYFGGRIDALIMRVVDLMLGFPTILVALMLLALLGQGLWKVIFALILVQWATFARAVRSAALVEKNKDYVEAAQTLGISTPRILIGHLLPNCLPPLIVIGMLQVANAISAEATLSFLGIGLPITEPSLGLLIANGYQLLMSGEYWISVYPGVLLLLLVFSINIVGDRLREVLNPRLGER
ncbi:ABC transporter permease [Neorhizobium sp. CSC1952]|uniref:ABC transporter permease n=1 Tax=Neorhizobium sp. CSC1952 TaxID=2978974 RepID=UPI0025A57D9B|nr:ABC transporter permease [Rhizobium sp. CSC1952]WJR67014.1 ABC transporter permease [Rhizobium sp. CSC1952]